MPKPLHLLLIHVLLAAAAPVLAQDDDASAPLGLHEALEAARTHPRATASQAQPFPRRPPLYLGCHDLAYGHTTGDERRNRPLDALLDPVDAQRLEILARFFDVLLADLSFARYNEAMAVAYIQYDRANVRRELGQYSELRVAELEAAYQDVRRKRVASQSSQRLTRSLLAQAIGRPDALPRDLEQPVLPPLPAEPPLLEQVVAAAADGNPRARQLSQEAGEEGAALVDMELRQQALELLLRLDALAAAAQHTETELMYTDLKLDESRTLYEQEVRADLGFSMSRQTRARLEAERVAYCRALTWAELNALQGRPLWPQSEAKERP